MKISKWLIPQLLIFLVLGLKVEIALAFFWITLHELAHYVIAMKVGAKVDGFKVHCLGATLELNDYEELSQSEQIIICFSGPLFNFIVAGICYFLYKIYGSGIAFSCYEVNLILGLFNIIPAYPLDGARILSAFLSQRMLYKKAKNTAVYISYFAAGVMALIFGATIVYIHKLSIFILVFSVVIIYETYQEKRKVMYIIMGDIIKKRNKLIKKKYIDNKSVSVYYNQNLINILSLVEKNKFHTFYVLDDDMKLMYILREDELMDALKTEGNITLKEYQSIKESLK